jgi:hypothetical protein
MNTLRWLLPFTWGVDMQAIDYAIRLAENGGATLVAVSLVTGPDKLQMRGARLEHIQQSKDFLEAVKWKAARLQVPLECYEVFTPNVLGSIKTLVYDLHCDSMILVSRGKQDALLRVHELKRLLIEPPAPLMLLRLVKSQEQPHLQAQLLLWLRQLLGRRTEARPLQQELEANHPFAIGAEELR